MADPNLTNIVDVLSTVGVPAATCWGVLKWALPRLMEQQTMITVTPHLAALERRIREQQQRVLQEISRNTEQISRAMEKMADKLSDQAVEIGELRGEVRSARSRGAFTSKNKR